jgi:nitrate/nitrite transporter NarK
MGDALIQDFGINVEELGWFSATYYVSYSLLQVPLGIALDIWGPKRILRIGTIICVLGAVLFVMALDFKIALLGRMFIGMGAAASFIGSIRMSTLWFSPGYLAFSIGLLSAMGKLGGALANKTLPYLMHSGMNWQYVIGLLCAVGAVLALLIWIFLKNGPKDTFRGVSEVPSWALIQKEVWSVLKGPTVWMMGLYGYSMYLVLSVFSDTYSINFLSCNLDISKEHAGSLSSWAPIGSAIGASLISFLSDRFQQRRLFLRLCSCMTLAISSVIFFGPPVSPSFMRGLLFALGLASSGQILIFAIVAESFSSRLTGIATGITNALLMLGGALHNPLVGRLLSSSQDHGAIESSMIYTIRDYRVAFSSLTVCFFAASVISFFVKETHPSKHKTSVQPII